MYLILVSNFSEFRKGKDVNKNVVAKIDHNEYKNVLLNEKCLRHRMNRIKGENEMKSYEIKKNSFYCFDDKIYILDNGNHALILKCL